MQSIINLIRWKNLLMIALAQYLIKYALLQPFAVNMSLSHFEFSLLALATICIAAAGNIINDIYDIETDFINKPKQIIIGKTITEKTAYNLFIVFNVIGVGIGFFVSNSIGKSELFSIFVIISILLYLYASFLKQTFLIGNIIVSALVAFSIIIVGIFELIPAMTSQNQAIQLTFFKIILDYALFAFMLNFLREIAKDIEDVDGDFKTGMHTLPIVIGRERASKVLFWLSLIPLLIIIYYINTSLYKQPIAVGYFLIFLVGPLIYTSIKLFSAKTKKAFHSISNLLKLVMLFGMLSLLLYPIITH
ncbi:geranylgeranylglycerol-phosphate geranylgeranyltransferase [Yeosuana marina]|uniref:geranylgeranylglycerol-phosphate geranylgeranyltransferase n=1 Tax=Yeosuana marina TaxID=1565536 RepID=UPI0014243976|nr:geranylgeranylglycerol-phosphate geranylgeranyltransferase [Yeosuana marina]